MCGYISGKMHIKTSILLALQQFQSIFLSLLHCFVVQMGGHVKEAFSSLQKFTTFSSFSVVQENRDFMFVRLPKVSREATGNTVINIPMFTTV